MSTWRYLHSVATPSERDEITLLLLKRLRARRPAFVERRRAFQYHLIGDRRRARRTWWPFDPPSHKRTPFVIFSGLLGMTGVLATALAAASANHFETLLTIPAYGLFLTAVFQLRQRRLNTLASY